MALLVLSSSVCFAYNFTITKENFSNLYTYPEKIAYLTFDDGPNTKITPKILDILKSYNVKANFFLLGKQVELYPEIVKRQYEEGHFLGNHTYSHNNKKIYANINSFLEEIRKTDALIGKAIGDTNFISHVFRFPNGSTSNLYYQQKQQMIKQLEQIEYVYIDWNALNNDSMQKYSKSQLLKNLQKSIKGKNSIVVLMHDSGDVNNTYDVLEDSIEFLQKEGYSFKTFYDLID